MFVKSKWYFHLDKFLIIAIFMLCASDVMGDPKTIGPVCEYVTTTIEKDGKIISQERVQVCEEKVIEGDKEMDPEVKQAIIEVATYATLIAILSKLN